MVTTFLQINSIFSDRGDVECLCGVRKCRLWCMCLICKLLSSNSYWNAPIASPDSDNQVFPDFSWLVNLAVLSGKASHEFRISQEHALHFLSRDITTENLCGRRGFLQCLLLCCGDSLLLALFVCKATYHPGIKPNNSGNMSCGRPKQFESLPSRSAEIIEWLSVEDVCHKAGRPGLCSSLGSCCCSLYLRSPTRTSSFAAERWDHAGDAVGRFHVHQRNGWRIQHGNIMSVQ